jgi:hypothetical protein
VARLRNHINEENRKQCGATFLHCQRKLKEKQGKELQFLAEKEERALRTLNVEFASHENIVRNRMNVSAQRRGKVWPAKGYGDPNYDRRVGNGRHLLRVIFGFLGNGLFDKDF